MKNRIIISLAIGCTVFLNGCIKDLFEKKLSDKRYTTDEQMLVASYVQKNDSLTTLAKLLKRNGRDIVLGTYGTYTLFAPTDRAFVTYLTSIGKNSIDGLTDSEVDNLVNYHISLTKISLNSINNGLISDTTINGLHIFFLNKGQAKTLNKVARVISNIEVSNGLVYIINNVLDPPSGNLYDYLSQSGKFSIMAKVFEQAGLKDTLQTIRIPNPYSDLSNYYLPYSFTLFVESDNTLNSRGINSFEALKQAVWNNSQNLVTDEDLALKAFAQYHIASGMRFVFQMNKEENYTTFALNRSKVIHINGYPDALILPKLNATLDNGSVTGGINFIDDQSDKLVKNGVIHQIDNILYVPESLPAVAPIVRECEHGTRSYMTSFESKFVLQDATIENGRIYFFQNNNLTTDELDYFGMGTALRFTPSDIGGYIEFIIKNVPAGKYEVRLNYQRDRTYASRNVNVYFRKSGTAFDYKSMPLYTGFDMANINNKAPVDNDYNQKRLLGTVTVTEYADYLIRFAHADLYYGTYDAIYLKPVN